VHKQQQEQEAAVEVTADEVGEVVTTTESEPNDYVQPTIEDIRKTGRNGDG
jgi:hypothetical protein